MSPARARTQTTRSREERTNHEATGIIKERIIVLIHQSLSDGKSWKLLSATLDRDRRDYVKVAELKHLDNTNKQTLRSVVRHLSCICAQSGALGKVPAIKAVRL